jgi:putative transcriptional regulator
VVAADTALVFEVQDDSKWQRALAKLGVSPEMLSGESGRA